MMALIFIARLQFPWFVVLSLKNKYEIDVGHGFTPHPARQVFSRLLPGHRCGPIFPHSMKEILRPNGDQFLSIVV